MHWHHPGRNQLDNWKNRAHWHHPGGNQLDSENCVLRSTSTTISVKLLHLGENTYKNIMFPAGFEPATLCVWSTRDNHYTKETSIHIDQNFWTKLIILWHFWNKPVFMGDSKWHVGQKDKKWSSSHLGIEPRTFGLEVQRAILCANGTPHIENLKTCHVIRSSTF